MPAFRGLPPPIRRLGIGAGVAAGRRFNPQAGGLPQIPKEVFEYSEQLKRQEEPGGLLGTGLPSIWDLLNVLGTGEYIVSNLASNIMGAIEGEESFDPFGAVSKGFTAGLYPEQGREHQKRIFDVLTEAGWEPDEGWNLENMAKHALGFGLGVVTDPIFGPWTGMGAPWGAAKIGKRTAREVQNDLLEESIKHGGRAFKGLPYSQIGEKARDAMYGSRMAEVKKAGTLGRMTGLGQETLPWMKGPQHSLSQAGWADKKLYRSMMSTEGMSWDDIKVLKPKELVEPIYKAAFGKEMTDKGYAWFLQTGYKQLRDPSGIRWFGKRFFASRGDHYNPLASEAAGWTLGAAWQHGTPVHHAIATKITEGQWWDDWVTNGLREWIRPVTSALLKFEGMGSLEKAALKRLDSALSVGKTEAMLSEAAILGVPGEGRTTIVGGGLSFETPQVYRPLETSERRLIGRYLAYARKKGLEGEGLRNSMVKHLTDPDSFADMKHWLSNTKDNFGKLGKRINQKLAEEISSAAVNFQNFQRTMGSYMVSKGVLLPEQVTEQYMSKQFRYLSPKWRKNKELLNDWGTNKGGLHQDDWGKPMKVAFDFEDSRNAMKAGDGSFPGVYEDDIREIYRSYMGSVFGAMHQRDAINSLTDVVARYSHRPGAELGILSNKAFREKYPDLVEVLSKAMGHQGEVGRGTIVKELAGLAQSDLNGVNKVLDDLFKHAKVNPERTAADVQRLIAAGKKVVGATPDQVNAAGKAMKLLVKEKERAAAEAVDHTVKDAQQAVIDELKKGIKGLQNAMTEQGIHKAGVRSRLLNTERGKAAVPDIRPPDMTEKTAGKLKKISRGEPESYAGMDPTSMKAATKAPVEAATGLRGGQRRALTKVAEKQADLLTNLQEATAATLHAERQVIKKGFTGKWWGDYIGRGRETQRQISGRMKELHTGMEELGRRKVLGEGGRTRLQMYDNEFKTLQEINVKLPGQDFLTKNADELQVAWTQRMKDVDELTSMAKAAGAEHTLATVIRHVSPGKNLESMSDSAIKSAKKLFTPAATKDEAVARFFRPKMEGEEIYQLFRGDKFKVPVAMDTNKKVSLREIGGDRQMANVVARMMKLKEPGAMDTLFHKLDYFTTFFRRMVTGQYFPFVPIPRLAFHLRNKIDLSVRTALGYGMMAPFDLEATRIARDVLSGKKGKLSVNGLDMSYEDIFELMKQTGHFSKHFQRFDVAVPEALQRGLSETGRKYFPGLLDTMGKAERWVGKQWFHKYGAQQLGTHMENLAATRALVLSLKAGNPFHQAVEQLGQFLFYYRGMTDLDKGLLRTIFPFWSFQKQAYGFLGQAAMRRPSVIAAYGRVRDMSAMTPEEMALMPEWAKEYPFLNISKTAKGFKIASLRNIFTVDVFPEALPKDMASFLSQMNPMFMAPIEHWLGTEAFMKRDIPKVKYLYDQMRTGFMRKTFGQFLQPRNVEIDGKSFVAVNGSNYHLLRRTFFGRLYRELDDVSDYATGKLGEEGIASLLIGFKTIEIDLERQATILRKDAGRAKREYDTARKRGDHVRANEIIKELRFK